MLYLDKTSIIEVINTERIIFLLIINQLILIIHIFTSPLLPTPLLPTPYSLLPLLAISNNWCSC